MPRHRAETTETKLQVYRENDEFIRSLITSGAIYCRGCCGQLANLPAAHVAPPQPLPTHPQHPPQTMPNNSAHNHYQVGQPMPEGYMEPLQSGDPLLGAGALDIDLDDIGFWLNENDSGN
ncbi:hypothetical protein AAVH_29835 [Aphelenchoides avenae]|nr:hypothetical protein AAVH_29835 [Aphelenchus avenae]